jgi:hypothetical protein
MFDSTDFMPSCDLLLLYQDATYSILTFYRNHLLLLEMHDLRLPWLDVMNSCQQQCAVIHVGLSQICLLLILLLFLFLGPLAILFPMTINVAIATPPFAARCALGGELEATFGRFLARHGLPFALTAYSTTLLLCWRPQ